MLESISMMLFLSMGLLSGSLSSTSCHLSLTSNVFIGAISRVFCVGNRKQKSVPMKYKNLQPLKTI